MSFHHNPYRTQAIYSNGFVVQICVSQDPGSFPFLKFLFCFEIKKRTSVFRTLLKAVMYTKVLLLHVPYAVVNQDRPGLVGERILTLMMVILLYISHKQVSDNLLSVLLHGSRLIHGIPG